MRTFSQIFVNVLSFGTITVPFFRFDAYVRVCCASRRMADGSYWLTTDAYQIRYCTEGLLGFSDSSTTSRPGCTKCVKVGRICAKCKLDNVQCRQSYINPAIRAFLYVADLITKYSLVQYSGQISVTSFQLYLRNVLLKIVTKLKKITWLLN